MIRLDDLLAANPGLEVRGTRPRGALHPLLLRLPPGRGRRPVRRRADPAGRRARPRPEAVAAGPGPCWSTTRQRSPTDLPAPGGRRHRRPAMERYGAHVVRAWASPGRGRHRHGGQDRDQGAGRRRPRHPVHGVPHAGQLQRPVRSGRRPRRAPSRARGGGGGDGDRALRRDRRHVRHGPARGRGGDRGGRRPPGGARRPRRRRPGEGRPPGPPARRRTGRPDRRRPAGARAWRTAQCRTGGHRRDGGRRRLPGRGGRSSPRATTFVPCVHDGWRATVRVPWLGAHSARAALVALAVADHFGVDRDAAVAAMGRVGGGARAGSGPLAGAGGSTHPRRHLQRRPPLGPRRPRHAGRPAGRDPGGRAGRHGRARRGRARSCTARSGATPPGWSTCW